MDTKFKIEKNIPIPGEHGNTKYPFKLLEVGDSFYVEGIPSSARTAAHSYAKRYGVKLVSKREKKGYRIWRTE